MVEFEEVGIAEDDHFVMGFFAVGSIVVDFGIIVEVLVESLFGELEESFEGKGGKGRKIGREL